MRQGRRQLAGRVQLLRAIIYELYYRDALRSSVMDSGTRLPLNQSVDEFFIALYIEISNE